MVVLLEKLCKQSPPRRSCGKPTCYDCTETHKTEESLRRRGAAAKSPTKTGQAKTHGCKVSWRPLVLFLPLRLGLSEMNPVYNDPFKVRTKVPPPTPPEELDLSL